MSTAEVVIILITGTLTLLVFVVFIILILIEYKKRQTHHITEKLEMKYRYQQEVLQTKLEVQEQSFRFFSEEVHDNIAQMLALAKMKMFKTAGKTADEKVKGEIEDCAELVGKTLDDLRNLSHVLNGGYVSQIPLTESIEKEIHAVRNATHTTIKMQTTGKIYELPGEKRLMIFRIVQEALGNALKHGKADDIAINLAYSPAMLIVTIKDNGQGFDTHILNKSRGLGLRNMQVRARLLGTINFESETGTGTTITLNVNNDEQQNQDSAGR